MMESERLYIRPFAADDADDLYAYLSRERVVRYEPYPPFTREQAAAEAARRAADPHFHAVVLKDSGRVIGNLYFAPGEFDTWELGYLFHDAYWGRGYAAEACRTLLTDALTRPHVHRVIALCNPENTASWRLMERLGMRREGTFIRNVWFSRDENGHPVWQDTYQYAILREELAQRLKSR